MATFELVMPKMGESIIEATILNWSKQVGDDIAQDETILEIATDKVDSELPSPVDGKLLEMRFNEGDVVAVGTVIALIETEAVQAEEAALPVQITEAATSETVAEVVPATSPALATSTLTNSNGNTRFFSPLVLNIARKEGIDRQVLETLSGTGREGRVTKKDMLAFIKQREAVSISKEAALETVQIQSSSVATVSPTKARRPITQKSFTHSGSYEIVEMSRMRKMIAENMLYSTQVSAHVTSFVEADVTAIVKWRLRMKEKFQQQYGEKLTFTPFFAQAVVKALREHPTVNSSVDGNNILIKKEINLGVAVALPTDNLIVPVVKQADHLSLAGLAAAISELARRARENKLKPSDLEGGTYTLSNVGTFGNVMGTPIIMQPQVAILAVGAIRKLPAVLETAEGDVIAIRHKMFLSHSYDHRVIDGALGGKFVRRVADLLESWDPDTEI